MGYEDVEVQSKGSWDDGVDVTAWLREQRLMGLERIKVLGQCKRYRQSSLLGPDVVEKMVESLKLKQGGRGVIITTSGFQPAAIERARSYKQIEMITGADLQVLLDKHFDKGLYRVGE
jgi:restriction endonuclease Mrr